MGFLKSLFGKKPVEEFPQTTSGTPTSSRQEEKPQSAMDKGRATWKENLERNHPEVAHALRDQRFVTAIDSIDQAHECEQRGDFMMARTAYMRAVESLSQYDTLTNGSSADSVAFLKKEYQEFVVERDPFFKEYLSDLLPIIKANPGILQTELYPKTSVEKSNVSYCLYFADAAGIIKRVKKGRTYQLTAE